MTRGRKKRLPTGERSRDLPDRQAHEIERLKQENERLRKQLEEQQKKIADLERQLALRQQNSTTTSKPPSSDGLAGQQRVRGRRFEPPHDRRTPYNPLWNGSQIAAKFPGARLLLQPDDALSEKTMTGVDAVEN